MYLPKVMTKNNSEIASGDLIENLFRIQNEGIDISSDSKKGEVSIRVTTFDETKTIRIKRQKDNLSEIITTTSTKASRSEEEERKIISFYRANNLSQDETSLAIGKSQSTISIKENNE